MGKYIQGKKPIDGKMYTNHQQTITLVINEKEAFVYQQQRWVIFRGTSYSKEAGMNTFSISKVALKKFYEPIDELNRVA